MMDFRLLSKYLGGFFCIFAIFLAIPGLFSIIDSNLHTQWFFYSSGGLFLLGLFLLLILRKYSAELNHRTSFALVTLTWLFAGIGGCLPYFLSGTLPSLDDAIFESVSGFTGTGASVVTNIESWDRALLLWRSLTQWLGGMGIIVFFVAILPLLGVGGMQLFRAEVVGPSKDKITPRVTETARKLWMLYVIFTVILAVFLRQAGMTGFDAVNHALTTLSAGGFSTKNAGIAAYQKPLIDYLIMVFMLIGAINFTIHYRIFVQQDGRAFMDTELRWFLGLIAGATLLVTLILFQTYGGLKESFRYAAFTVISTLSTTGFSNHIHPQLPPALSLVVVLLMVMGGMSGSTAGGLKCIRLVAAFKQLIKQLKLVVHPSAVLTVKANNRTISESVIDAMWGLIFLYFLVFSVAAGILCLQGFDLLAASATSLSALSNIGPALGELTSSASYASLPLISKMTLCICMLLGRLEFFTVLVIFTVAFWKK